MTWMYLNLTRFCLCSLYRKNNDKKRLGKREGNPNLFEHVTPNIYIYILVLAKIILLRRNNMLNKKDLLTRIYLTLKQFILQKSCIIQQRFVAFKKNLQESVCNFIKRETPAHKFFPVNLAKIFRTGCVEHLQMTAPVKLFRSWARHSNPKLFYKKVFLKNSASSRENTCTRLSLLMKL